MKQKKLFYLLLSCILIGCSTSSYKNNEEFSYLLFIAPLKDYPAWLQAKQGFLDGCEEFQFQCKWAKPSSEGIEAMNDEFETGILQQADSIIAQGVIDDYLIEKATSSGIPVLLFDHDMPDSSRTAFIGKNFKIQAELLLSDIEKQLGSSQKLNIAIQVAKENHEVTQEQILQVQEMFQNHKGGFEIVDISTFDADASITKTKWQKILSEHPDINIMLNFAEGSAESCYEISMIMNKREQMLIYSIDDRKETLNLIRDDKIDGAIQTSYYDFGYNCVKYLNEYYLSAESLDDNVTFSSFDLITKNNVEEYERENKE